MAWSPAWTCVEVLVAVVIVLELVLVPAFRSWSPLCSRWNVCRRLGRRYARFGTSVVLVLAFRSWSLGGWKAGEGCACDQGMDSGVVSVVDSLVDSGSILGGILGDLAF